MSLVDTLNNGISYAAGWCTAFVAGVLSWIPAGLGDARDWLANAPAAHLQVGSQPVVGAVASFRPGVGGTSSLGHVAVVTGVNPDGSFEIQEQAGTAGWGQVDTRTIGANDPAVAGFILPPGIVTPGIGGNPIPGIPGVTTPGIGGGSIPGMSQIANAISSIPTNIGHGLANATGAGIHDVEVWTKRNAVALFVALAVTVVLFGPSVAPGGAGQQ